MLAQQRDCVPFSNGAELRDSCAGGREPAEGGRKVVDAFAGLAPV